MWGGVEGGQRGQGGEGEVLGFVWTSEMDDPYHAAVCMKMPPVQNVM